MIPSPNNQQYPFFSPVPLKLSLKISNPWSTREADLSNNKPPSSCLADLESLKSSFTANHHLDKLVLFVQEARRTCLGIIRVDGGAAYPCPIVLSTEQPHKRTEPWMGIQWKLILLVTWGHWLEMKIGRSGNSRLTELCICGLQLCRVLPSVWCSVKLWLNKTLLFKTLASVSHSG